MIPPEEGVDAENDAEKTQESIINSFAAVGSLTTA